MLDIYPEDFTSMVSISPMSTVSVSAMSMAIPTSMVRFMVVTNLFRYFFGNLEYLGQNVLNIRNWHWHGIRNIIPSSEFGMELFCSVFLQHLCKLLWEPFSALWLELYGNFVLEHLCNVPFESFWEHQSSVPLALGSNVFWESKKVSIFICCQHWYWWIFYLLRYIMTMLVRFFVALFVISIPMALFCVGSFTLLFINCFIVVFTLKKEQII